MCALICARMCLCHRVTNAILCVMECLICEIIWNESEFVFIAIANTYISLAWHVFRNYSNFGPDMRVNPARNRICSAKRQTNHNHFVRTMCLRATTGRSIRLRAKREKIECDAFTLHNAMLNKMWPCEDDGWVRKCLVQHTIKFWNVNWFKLYCKSWLKTMAFCQAELIFKTEKCLFFLVDANKRERRRKKNCVAAWETAHNEVTVRECKSKHQNASQFNLTFFAR